MMKQKSEKENTGRENKNKRIGKKERQKYLREKTRDEFRNAFKHDWC